MADIKQLVKLTTKGAWDEGVKTSIYIRDFAPVIMDEPEDLGGTNQGANPMEYVLASLTGCASVMISMISKEKNFQYSRVEFENTGVLDVRGLMGVPSVSPHFQTVRYHVRLTTDESVERVDELRKEVERRCPVYNLLKDAGVHVQSTWTIK
ncbi:OsmC family protein [Bacillus sp. REN10]|uniref:OsmC family protein n=1 Tax=Bacillus sp. REN10 TaxID=2782541 RepID=UPI00193BAF8D|nr:OsmC family protein [Bacillus sp. REN10]